MGEENHWMGASASIKSLPEPCTIEDARAHFGDVFDEEVWAEMVGHNGVASKIVIEQVIKEREGRAGLVEDGGFGSIGTGITRGGEEETGDETTGQNNVEPFYQTGKPLIFLDVDGVLHPLNAKHFPVGSDVADLVRRSDEDSADDKDEGVSRICKGEFHKEVRETTYRGGGKGRAKEKRSDD